MALLEVRGLVKQYGRRIVVNGVDVDVDAGEIVGLLGPNGAGKTTSFRMIAGMIPPKAGVVTFDGRDITHMPMFRRARLGLGYLAQDSSVFRRLTVEQNLWAILQLMTTSRGKPFRATYRQKCERVERLLAQFGLTHLKKSLALNLSGGERRRLEIARCLLTEPMLIMLDEPFTGIDPKTVSDIQAIIRSLRDDGIGVLITDHHVAETLRITDHSYLIANGKMLTKGNPNQIMNDPKAQEVYLGKEFLKSYGFATAQSTEQRIKAVLENEQILELVDQLAGRTAAAAAEQLIQLGDKSVPYLLDSLTHDSEEIRFGAYRALCLIRRTEWSYDPAAEESVRRRQIQSIRAQLYERKAA